MSEQHHKGYEAEANGNEGLGDREPTGYTASYTNTSSTDPDHVDLSITDVDVAKGDVRTRDTWSRKIDFLLACIGFSVGLGNVWRFPYLCYRNGGGAFLFPYLICVIIGGIPMFFLEVALGQFMSEGGIMAWKISPLFMGIGYATTVIVFLLNCYYNVILCWAFYYFFASMTTVLPWSHCDNEWNTKPTNLSDPAALAASGGKSIFCTIDFKMIFADDGAAASNHTNITYVHPVTEFWERKVLAISDGIESPGIVKWDLALCLLLAWIVVYLCIWKGIKTSGKVMYFTATSPYVFMFILMIRGLTLEGAIDGIVFYLKPNFQRMLDSKVWVDAGTQIFFSYSISLGTLTALGSYNKFNHNSYRDCVVFAGVNSGTSIFSGFVIFSVLGHMARVQNVPVDKAAESGPGLAFIAYPMALSKMPGAPIWSVIFFFMVILLGLDSEFVGVEGFITAVSDLFPRFMRRGYNKEIFIGVSCFFCFLIGLSMITEGGMYVFQLFDFYSGSRIILLIAFVECIVVGWVYGADRFLDNLEMMFGFRVTTVWKWMWMIVTPIFTVVMFILSAINYQELTYEFSGNKKYVYPGWAITIGWIMAFSSIIFIPIVAAWKFLNASGEPVERLRKLIRPRLRRHQLRDQDDREDLDPEEREKVGATTAAVDAELAVATTANHGSGAIAETSPADQDGAVPPPGYSDLYDNNVNPKESGL